MTTLTILLGRRIELSPEIAQKLITVTLREVYLRYAFYATLVALMFCGVALVLWLRL